jgi:hypothetical protein
LPFKCNLQRYITGTIFKDANLSGAIVSGANLDDLGDLDGSVGGLCKLHPVRGPFVTVVVQSSNSSYCFV